MDRRRRGTSETRFSAYVDDLVSVIGHADRERPLRDYCTGLLMPCERKSVEPMAAVTAPERTAAQHQSLLHFIGEGRWSDEKVLAKVQEIVLPAVERNGPIEAWIIDDTAFPQERNAFCGGGAPVLRSTRQAGQLSGSGVTVGCQSSCQLAGGLSAISAGGLGLRRCSPQEGRRARPDRLSDQDRDRARPDPCGLRCGLAAWRRSD